jgi:hypothetical protein
LAHLLNANNGHGFVTLNPGSLNRTILRTQSGGDNDINDTSGRTCHRYVRNLVAKGLLCPEMRASEAAEKYFNRA